MAERVEPTIQRNDDRRDHAFLRHALMLLLLVGGLFVSHTFAQSINANAVPIAAMSLLDRWLEPHVVISAALVLLYVGELRGDVKRLKADTRALEQRLHDDYMTKETIRAELRARAS